jgi:two-component system, cell cycle sensor histidine kinase and response regulator CckA
VKNGPVRILMIEDDPEFERLVRVLLTRASIEFELHRFETEKSVEDALANSFWSVALVDFKMPGWDGLNATRYLRARAPEIPIIILSAHLDEIVMKKFTDAGATDCLPKTELFRLQSSLARAFQERNEITLRHQAERSLEKTETLLRQSQKMEAIGSLAGSIAHDFNNILSVILMQCEVSLQVARDPKVKTEFGQIHKTALRAAGLTKQLLAFSRGQVMQPKYINVNTHFIDVAELYSRLIGENIQLVTQLSREVQTVYIEPTLLEQVTMNLVINAKDAMPRGGRLTITTDSCIVNDDAPPHSKPGPFTTITVSDTGEGMDAETQLRMFEPFFTTKEHSRGTGLGLATVYGIVTQCGGFITVDSKIGAGTSVKIFLPVATGIASDFQLPETSVLRGNETILLVEDEEDLLQLMNEVFKTHGYTVLTAKDYERGSALIRKHKDKIQLLVTDVVLSKGDGCMLAKELNAVKPKAQILFMSGYLDETMERMGIDREKQFMIEKPFAVRSILEKVRRILDLPGVS